MEEEGVTTIYNDEPKIIGIVEDGVMNIFHGDESAAIAERKDQH